ncbi:unnamed protein product [Rangifer tarandus platyrhynchus]|uniref:Uncharacterized protein n=2 Tax=Rangifer tarandus platyrhynchus TaxID=3082113 RepID=A0ABN8YAK6_RANTA|nr:unnamed protein product [Rangifer tarandus platyrhynchus]
MKKLVASCHQISKLTSFYRHPFPSSSTKQKRGFPLFASLLFFDHASGHVDLGSQSRAQSQAPYSGSVLSGQAKNSPFPFLPEVNVSSMSCLLHDFDLAFTFNSPAYRLSC